MSEEIGLTIESRRNNMALLAVWGEKEEKGKRTTERLLVGGE